MDQNRENELLLHVAAGTDLPMALAALPHQDDVYNELPVRAQAKPVGGLNWAVLVFISMIACWWLMS